MYGEFQGGRLGRAVSGGDLNGDGFAEVIATAPKSSADSGERAGYVYLVYGSPSPQLPHSAGDAAEAIGGRAAEESLGSGIFARPALRTADMNRDGLADLIIGAPTAGRAENSSEGEVRLYYAHAD
jgi:hypothetical protein